MTREGYPPFDGPRSTLAAAVEAGGGRVAGRLRTEHGARWLVDETACVRLATNDAPWSDGDWISARLALEPGAGVVLAGVVRHAACRGRPDVALAERLPLLRRRAAIVDAVRSWFRGRGFLEVETPTRVRCPGLEPHLVAFPAGGGRHLITSPELHLKRLLAAGAERVVELARAFRDEERGSWHLDEFTMLEWYRAFAGLEAIERDCEALVAVAARAAGDVRRVGGCAIGEPFERTTVREALLARTGLDLARLGSRAALADAVRARGHDAAADDGWDELFFRVWIAEIEPTLGRERPTIVRDWPPSQAALARLVERPDGAVADRFELYVSGIELANAFAELNDPDEQRRRHEADREARRAAGREVYPLDEPFLDALDAGMPPAAGIALGLDRLVALLLGAESVAAVRAFP